MSMDKDKYAARNLSASGNTTGNTQNGSTKSSAQVESLVLPNPSALQRKDGITGMGITRRRSSPLTIRLSDRRKRSSEPRRKQPECRSMNMPKPSC